MGAETWEHPVSEQGEFISIGDNQVRWRGIRLHNRRETMLNLKRAVS